MTTHNDESPKPTDEAILKIAHRRALHYKHSADPNIGETYTFNRNWMLQFARDVLALAEQPQPAPMQGSRLDELLGQYWDLAYAEGKEGREHDTAAGDAQRVLSEIRALASRAEHAVPDGYQYRRIDPEEGPSIWVSCDKTVFDYYTRNASDGYEVRPLFARTPTSNTGE